MRQGNPTPEPTLFFFFFPPSRWKEKTRYTIGGDGGQALDGLRASDGGGGCSKGTGKMEAAQETFSSFILLKTTTRKNNTTTPITA